MKSSANATDLIHHAYAAPAGFMATQPAVHKASTVIFKSVAAMRARDWKNKDGYTYGLHGTPTTFTLEARLASLEGGSHCLLTPSGLASIACVNLALLRSGDQVLIPSNSYGPNLTMAQTDLAAWGITHQCYDPMDPADLAARIGANTKLVWLEAAGSVTMEFPDLVALVRICRQHGVLCVLDNTWGAGLALNAFELYAESGIACGVDMTVHALTKYPSGSANLLMGSVICRNDAIHERLKLSHMHMGWGVGANDVEMVLAGLNSLHLRYAAQDRTARSLAVFLQSRPEIAQVLHPALPGSLGHEAWQRICSDKAAGIFSVVFQPHYTQVQVDRFCEALQWFKLGYSWAGPISLVVPYQLEFLRSEWPKGVAKGCLVRLCIGLEDAADLQADLESALLVV